MMLSSHYRGHHLLIQEYNPSERKPSHVRWVWYWLKIDSVISNSKFVKYSKVTNKILSDHFAVECVRKKKTCERSKYVYRTLRDYKNYDKEILVDLLLNRLSIDDFVDLDDPNVM